MDIDAGNPSVNRCAGLKKTESISSVALSAGSVFISRPTMLSCLAAMITVLFAKLPGVRSAP
jgi:hypothetical protein